MIQKQTSSNELRASLALQPNNPYTQKTLRLSLRSELPGFHTFKNWALNASKPNSNASIFVRALYVLFVITSLILIMVNGITNVWLELYLAFWSINLALILSFFIYIPVYDYWLFVRKRESRTLFNKKLKIEILIELSLIIGILCLSVLSVVQGSTILYHLTLALTTLFIMLHKVMNSKPEFIWASIYLIITISFLVVSIIQFNQDMYLFITSNLIFRILVAGYYKVIPQKFAVRKKTMKSI